MKQIYTFFDGGPVEFDDAKTVRELIAYAFDRFGFYEPLGMETVTLFQAHHPDTDDGWFTTDTARTCAEEIKNPHELCFAYHLPGVLYYAEGGWGHHMASLGNHPHIPDAVSLNLRFEEFDHMLVLNGQLCLRDIIRLFQQAGYIGTASAIRVIPVGCADQAYTLPLSDPIVHSPMAEFHKTLQQYHKTHIRLGLGDFISHEILHIC